MKFLHTADLHLDSSFSLSSATDAAVRRQRQRDLLREIFEIAKQESCDMLLVAGDLFDSVYVTPETKELCGRLFSDFGKPIIISPGNHDPYVEGSFYRSELPENVYVFSSPELQYFDFPELDTTVAGYAFVSGALAQSPLAAEAPVRHNQRIMLLCAHGDVDMPTSRYANIPSSVLEKLGYDYVALGHVHKYTEVADNIRYVGFCEGRAFDELGEGGILIVSTDGLNECSVERRILSKTQYLIDELSVDGAGSAEQIRSAVSEYVAGLAKPEGVYLRLELVGVISPEAQAGIDTLGSQLGENLLFFELINSTLALPSGDFLAQLPTLRGEYYRSLLPLLESENADERRRALAALRIGLAAIDGKDFTDKVRVKYENNRA